MPTLIERIGAVSRPRGATDSDMEFAMSLIAAHRRYGSLTERQTEAAERMLARIAERNAPAPPAAPTVSTDLERVRRMFASASGHLRRPSIVVPAREGEEIGHRWSVNDRRNVRLSLLGQTSRWPGQIAVTENRTGRGRVYYGRIDAAGAFVAAGAARGFEDQIRHALEDFAADPEGVAGAFGRRTGQCCFCMRGLTDARSVSVGYGPVCADHYGLPWGQVTGTDGQPYEPDTRRPRRATVRVTVAAASIRDTQAPAAPRRLTVRGNELLPGDRNRDGDWTVLRIEPLNEREINMWYRYRNEGERGPIATSRDRTYNIERSLTPQQVAEHQAAARRAEAERLEAMRRPTVTGVVTFKTVTNPTSAQRAQGWLD